ncbi:MAG: SPOR domain-containing protein [Pseudomonadota bacterium]
MLIRITVFLLLAVNIGLYALQVTRPPASPAAPRAAPLPLEVPELVLLREREADLLAGLTTSSTDPTAETSACFALGPFSNQADLRRAFNALAPQVARSRQRQTVETQDRGFWVFLPAVASREEALGVARDLSGAGLRDYYVVTAGPEENTISLGLFRLEDNARRRQEALRSLGFRAELARRTEESRAYWLDYAGLPDVPAPWERIVASNPGVDRRPIPCFRPDDPAP